jgi:lipopolysaccharide transport system permease protein
MSTADTTKPSASAPVVIEPTQGWLGLNVREIWQFRNVLGSLVGRDIKVRYKQTVLGFLWAFLQPVLKMVVFTVIFGRWAGMGPQGYPYPVFVLAGILPWELFSASVTRASESIVSQQQFITKVYFPRLIIPLSVVGAALVDFAVAFVILIGLAVYYPQVHLGLSLLSVFPLVLLTVLVSAGAGTLFAALNVAYRDVRHAVPFIVQLWMFLTPVIYPVTLVPERLRWLLNLNPMTGVIAGFRWAVLGQPIDWSGAATSLAVAVSLCVAGMAYFRRTERVFADIV